MSPKSLFMIVHYHINDQDVMFTNIDNNNDDNIKYKSDKKMSKLSEPHNYCMNINEMFSKKSAFDSK
jgi:hypothetical protein